MATFTERRASANAVVGQGAAYTKKNWTGTVELAASASGTLINGGYIPSNARIVDVTLYNDDLATSGSPTLDIGLAAVDSNVTSDPDAIGNGFALSSAGSRVVGISDAANIGLPAWDFVNGVSSDPGGSLRLYATVKDAATTATGTISLSVDYVID